MNSVVMLSYYFPPLVGIASERAAAFARHLPESGWNPVVIAPRQGFYHRVQDPGIVETSVVRTRNPEISRFFRRGFGVATGTSSDESGLVVPVTTSPASAWLRRFAHEVLYVPDGQLGWVPFAGHAAARELARLPKRSVLYSSSVPFSGHLAAMWARRQTGTRWIAEFRDPWTEGVLHEGRSSAMRRRLDRTIQRSILRTATRIVVVTTGLRDLLLAAFPELDPERVDIVMNGFEPGPVGAPPAPNEPMRVLYAGTVAPGEDVGPILKAVELVHEQQPGRLRFTVVGPPNPWRERLGRDEPWLELRGLQTPEQARSVMRSASALFLLQSHEAYAAALPGKLFEYVGARRPILAAVPESFSMVGLLRAHADLRLVPSLSERALAAQIERLLSEHTAGKLQSPSVPEELVKPLERRAQARRLAAVFDRASES